MEELVGKIWHRLVSSRTQTEYSQARVLLSDIESQLAPYYRAMGGAPARLIEGAPMRRVKTHRPLLNQLAGSHLRFPLTWQDERSLRLPPSIACFPERELNEKLYYWLAALAARQPKLRHWFQDNQQACRALLQHYPGLRNNYFQLVEATLRLRAEWLHLEGAAQQRELAIRAALRDPGSVAQLPVAARDPLPVLLWLYPEPLRAVSAKADDQLEASDDAQRGAPQDLSQPARKEAQRVDDERETDGLMVFQPESLFSWAEQVALDRCRDEEEDDFSGAADDLDLISLSRQRRAGAAKVKFDLDLPAAENDDLPLGDGILLPEWDYKKALLIPDYCRLQPLLTDDAPAVALPEPLRDTARALRRHFALLRPQRQWQYRQPVGEELDLNAYLDSVTQPERGSEQLEVFRARVAIARDLSCLLLADLSMSTDAALTDQQRVIDAIRDTLLLFAEALAASGDRFAIYGFSSVKNKQVRFNLLKNFTETYGDLIRGRITAIKPGFYTRMGAAIRQSTEIIKQQQTQQRLLLIISDGKPNDIDRYEGRYGIEDTRQAILAAKREGLQPFCVTIDESGNEYLPYLFGAKGYAVVSDVQRLPQLLPKLYLNLTGAAG